MRKLLVGLMVLWICKPMLVRAIHSGTEVAAAVAEPADVAAPRVAGLWQRYHSEREGDPLRFYFFHEKGYGLYRYGRVGYNNTNSYDYSVERDRLVFKFRKTGERYIVPFRIEADAKESGLEWLVLEDDPREPGKVRYFRPKAKAAEAAAGVDWGRMWTCERKYATGGMGFRIYQFKDAAIDGRGVGWYHQGDYDDWSTESLTYRITGGRMELSFPLRHERFTTDFRLEEKGKERFLWLMEDPRNFWHRGAFFDGGKSFAAALGAGLPQ